MIKTCYVIAILILLFSCKEQEIKQYTPKIDYNYFPLQSGLWREFEVVSINIDSASEVYDTAHYFLRELHKQWILDAANDSVMLIERFYCDSLGKQWQPFGVWQAGIDNNEAQQVEENERYLKILFPVQINSSWDGNKYNRRDTLEQYLYTIISLNNPNTLNGLSFDSVLLISQKSKSTFVDKLQFEEQYAYGIGLISKKQVDIYSEITDDPTIPIENRVTDGTIYNQEIISYGFE